MKLVLQIAHHITLNRKVFLVKCLNQIILVQDDTLRE